MTIHNIYMVAGVLFWLYILLCLSVCVRLDGRRDQRRDRQTARIDRFFSQGRDQKQRDRDFHHLQREIQDDAMLDQVCRRYLAAAADCSSEQKALLDFDMKQLLHEKIAQVEKQGAASRCFLAEELCRCQLDSHRIQRFLLECSQGTPLERQWAARFQGETMREQVR